MKSDLVPIAIDLLCVSLVYQGIQLLLTAILSNREGNPRYVGIAVGVSLLLGALIISSALFIITNF